MHIELNLLYTVIYFVGMNVLTAFVYWHDKQSARKQRWRVSENSLLMIALLGGSPAAIVAMYGFKHKRRKGFFQFRFSLVLIAHGVIAAYIFMHPGSVRFI